MPNLAATLKEEIRRLAKKEVKAQTNSTKQAVAHYRREIAQLKRQLREQDKKIARLGAQARGAAAQEGVGADEEDAEGMRFSPQWVKSQRKRLGLSAADYAKLVGVSPLSVYNWEHGKNRPRKAQLAALASVRGIGKREAKARLEALGEAE